jgi:hypothetical protein
MHSRTLSPQETYFRRLSRHCEPWQCVTRRVGLPRAEDVGLRAHLEWRVGVVTPIRATSAAGGPKDTAWSAFQTELSSMP